MYEQYCERLDQMEKEVREVIRSLVTELAPEYPGGVVDWSDDIEQDREISDSAISSAPFCIYGVTLEGGQVQAVLRDLDGAPLPRRLDLTDVDIDILLDILGVLESLVDDGGEGLLR